MEIASNTNELGTLPPKTIHMMWVKMNSDEWEKYGKLANVAQKTAERVDSRQTAVLWSVMTHLRLMANTEAVLAPDVRKKLYTLLNADTADMTPLIDQLLATTQMGAWLEGSDDSCPICLVDTPDTITGCKHLYHYECITEWLENNEKDSRCALCREPLKKSQLVRKSQAQLRHAQRLKERDRDPVFDAKEEEKPFVESSKVRGLCDRIVDDLREPQTDGRPNKVIVFSTFVKVSDIKYSLIEPIFVSYSYSLMYKRR